MTERGSPNQECKLSFTFKIVTQYINRKGKKWNDHFNRGSKISDKIQQPSLIKKKFFSHKHTKSEIFKPLWLGGKASISTFTALCNNKGSSQCVKEISIFLNCVNIRQEWHCQY